MYSLWSYRWLIIIYMMLSSMIDYHLYDVIIDDWLSSYDEDFLGDLYHHGLCGVVIDDTNLP